MELREEIPVGEDFVSHTDSTLRAAPGGVALAYAFYAGTIVTMPSTAVALGFFILAGLASRFRWRSPTPTQWTKLSAIGAISYGLYVIHFPILFAAKEWFPRSWTAVLLAVPASFAAAVVLQGALQPRIRPPGVGGLPGGQPGGDGGGRGNVECGLPCPSQGILSRAPGNRAVA
jgi:hypothetical protein